MPEEMVDHSSELARRFYAALISKRLGIGMDYALSTARTLAQVNIG
jgi:hypothetical protein